MKVIKRKGNEEDFCLDKIIRAVKLANSTVPTDQQMNDEQTQKVINTVVKKLDGFTTISVEDINTFVEQSLVRHNKYQISKQYILYRENKKKQKKFTTEEEQILSLVHGDSELRGENANKHIDDNACVRDYIAGTKCKTIAEKILPEKIIKAHKSGLIHWHDMDYSPIQKEHNCFLPSQKFITDKGVRAFKDFNDGENVYVKDKDGNTRLATVHKYEPQVVKEYIFALANGIRKSVFATPNHRWFLNDGTTTENINIGDKLISMNFSQNISIENSEDAKMWCVGFIIGDGCDHGDYCQVRLCGNKNKYIEYFRLANVFRINETSDGDFIPYTKWFHKQDFLNGKCWKFLTPKQKALLFLGLYAADGRTKQNNICSSDERVIELIEECAGMANYFITSKKEEYHDTEYKKNAYLCTIRFLTIPTYRDYSWKLVDVKNYQSNRKQSVYCVVEPITHSFMLENGIPTSNCDLVDADDMLTNTFVMGDTLIEINDETPFRTACNLLAQINLQVSGRQYGGQTVSWSHLLKFVNNSRKNIRKEIIEEWEEDGVEYNRERLNAKVEKRLRKEIQEGVKTYQYQILCHQSSNGQTPFVSNNLCLREAETQQELDDFAIVIEEIFKRRIKGVKDKNGHWTTPLFPKLLYWICDGLNYKEGDPYFYLTKLAAECNAYRMQPDIVSEKETRRVKEGQIIPSMGCVDKDEVVTYKYQDKVYIESIKRMWNRMSNIFEVKLQDATDCYYINLENVFIFDSTKQDFVVCKRMNKNKDNGDWKMVKLSDGRVLTCTSDHPLAVVGKGRTFVSDIEIDDEIECTTFAYSENNKSYNADFAWLLGVILCDGCYDKQVSSTFALNGEDDVIERYQKALKTSFDMDSYIKEWHRGVKGEYKEVRGRNTKETQIKLLDIFGGLQKKNRQIPSFILNADIETRFNFLGGMIDADGYIHKSEKHFNTVEMGSTNKELALQTLHLINSLGLDGKVLINHYSSDLTKIRYRVYFNTTEEVLKYITCQKKKNNFEKINHFLKEKHFKVNEIIDLGYRDEYSYDVTTESDRFDVSGIASHNCRSLLSPIWEDTTHSISEEFYWDFGGTYPYNKFNPKRTFAELNNGTYKSGYDEGEICVNFRGNTGWLISKTDTEVIIRQPKVYGRWNNGVVTVNLPHVALEAVNSGRDFYEILDERLELCREALQLRYKRSQEIKAKNSPILWQFGALARMSAEETVGELMEKYPQRASISLGFVGLYETCVALIGQSNTTDEGRKLSKEILAYMNQKCYYWKEQDKINYSIYGTPEEALTYKFALANRRDFGLIEHITDKDYVVNSYHVDPRETIDAFTKLEIEGEYLALSAGGAVSYVETGDLTKNIEVIIKIIQWMYEHIVYAEINRIVGVCYECGHEGDMQLVKTENGVFQFICPHCGNTDDSKMNVKARLCGYLGQVNAGNTNKGRMDDIYNRKIHLDCYEE